MPLLTKTDNGVPFSYVNTDILLQFLFLKNLFLETNSLPYLLSMNDESINLIFELWFLINLSRK